MSVCKLRVLVIRLSPVLIAGLAAAFFLEGHGPEVRPQTGTFQSNRFESAKFIPGAADQGQVVRGLSLDRLVHVGESRRGS